MCLLKNCDFPKTFKYDLGNYVIRITICTYICIYCVYIYIYI